MDIKILKEIGLTDGEIRVYEALLHLGRSSTGGIMKKSGISSSKVYLILEKLIQKGLVSFVVENNVKKFQVTNPKSILDYVDKKKHELENVKRDFEKVVPQISAIIGEYEEEYAQIYKGVKGIKVAFDNLFEEMDKGDEYRFFGASKEEMLDKNVVMFFQNVHKKRISKGIYVRGIVDNKLKEFYKKKNVMYKKYSLKYYDLTLPTAIVMGKNRIIMSIWGAENIAYEIVSKRVADKYREFFDKIWEVAEK